MKYFFCDKYELGMWELKHDVLFNKIPAKQYCEFIDFAWDMGYHTAQTYMIKYETRVPTELAGKLELTLLELDNGYMSPEYRIFSEYMSNMKRIVLYKNTIVDEVKKLKGQGINGFEDYVKIRELFVAHEIYHHIECHDQGLTSRKKQIITFKLGPFAMTSGIRALCEIGAHSFTKEIMNL